MKLALNVRYFTDMFPLEEAAKMVADAGFDATDYALLNMINPENSFSGNDYLSVAENIGKVMRDGGVPIVQTHAPFQFKQFADPVALEDFIKPQMKRAVEVSAAMGADVIVVHPLHHMLYAGHEEEIFHMNMDYYRQLIPVAKSCGIKVAVENMFQVDPRRGCIAHDTCSTIREFLRYVDTLDSDQIVACLDVGHCGLPMQKDEAQDFIYALGHDRLKALHIHDNSYKLDTHGMPFSGKMDWDAITKALGQIDYTGDFTYELKMPSFMNSEDPKMLAIGLRFAHDVGRYLMEKVENSRPGK